MKFFNDISTIFWKELKVYFRWKDWVFFDAIGALLPFITFIFVWRAILMGGFGGVGELTPENYIPFMLSGSVLWTFITISMGHEITHCFIDEVRHRTGQNLLLSPVHKMAIPYGKALLSIVRATISNAVIIIFSLLIFGVTVKGSLTLVVLIIAINFFAFSGIGLIIAALGLWRHGLADSVWVIRQILYIFSGVHYPIEVLPETLKNISLLLPSTQAINMTRAILLKGAGIFDIWFSFLYLIIFAVIILIISAFAFKIVEGKAMIIGI